MTETATVDVVKIKNLEPQPFKRRIGFRHRVKQRIQDGEVIAPLPSQVTIIDESGNILRYDLPDEQAELDFINSEFPVRYRSTVLDEDVSGFKSWQVKWRASREEDHAILRHASQCKYEEKRGKDKELMEVAEAVPCEFVGFKPYDQLGMMLGGSGDLFAFAASRKLEEIGGTAYRIPPFHFDDFREGTSKDDDSRLLADLLDSKLEYFYPIVVRDRSIINVRRTYRIRMDAMKDRMACAQRLCQRHIGDIFCSEKGGFPEGDMEKMFDDIKANDPIYQAIEKVEGNSLRSMTEAVENTLVWKKVFSEVEGVGPGIAARLISCIVDIRRFRTEAKLMAFLGVHTIPNPIEGGSRIFPRRRNGFAANWSPDGRQAMYILADQFVKRKNSNWGIYYRKQKEKFRKKHPLVCISVKNSLLGIEEINGKKTTLVPLGLAPQKVKAKYTVLHPMTGVEITVPGTQIYTDGHIHKMALWRTLTRFVRWLYKEWWKIERQMDT